MRDREEEDDHVLSPYFFVKSEDAEVDSFPLKNTSVHARISGVIADVRVTQTYENRGRKPLECLYVFPMSTRAAVYRMEMAVGSGAWSPGLPGGRTPKRSIKEPSSKGKTASLLEQNRPNVFQMRVANILPGDRVSTDLFYTELLVPEDDIYQFVFPTVVGPRYSNRLKNEVSDSERRWVESPYHHSGEPPQQDLQLQVDLAGSVPLWDIACPSHDVEARFP